MRKLIPNALLAYTKPDVTWLPLLLLVLAVIPAVLGSGVAALILLAGSSIASIATRRQTSAIRALLETGGLFDIVLRALRLSVLLLVGSQIWQESGIAIAIACAGILLVMLSALTEITVNRLAARLIPEIFTRNLNVDMSGPRLPARMLAEGLALLVPELILIAAGCLIVASVPLAWIGAALTLLTLVVGTLATDWVLRTKGNAFRRRVLGDVQRAIKQLSPQVAFYLGSNDPATVYQLEGWLATAEGIDESTVIIVRSTEIFEALGKTSVPVIALVTAQDLIALDLSTLRACLFVANTGDVIHLIREQNPMSAFIGHGDSDKNSSFNPFTKVYDEVWVAGKAGEDRYSRAQIGVRPDQFASVGRPQLEAIDLKVLTPERPGHVPTVLYAPTWEGWNKEQQYCSLLAQGVDVVAELLRHDPPIRIIFKPHPFTGLREPKARAAANRISAMIRKSNAARGLSSLPAIPGKAGNVSSARESNERATAAGNAYFDKLDPLANIVVEPADGLGLFQCFEHSDALVTDVSSVLSDYMITDRPYAVCNPREASEAAFIEEFPSAGGGYIIDRKATNAAEFLGVVAGITPDSKRQHRREVRAYLLGEPTPSATQRFNGAVTALIERANERIAARD